LFEIRPAIRYLQGNPVCILSRFHRSLWLGKEDQAMIVISCPKCRAELEIPNQQGGKIVKCPECGVSLKIPMPRKESPPKETQIKAAPSRPMAAVPPKPRSPEKKEPAYREPSRKSAAKPKAAGPWLMIGVVGGSLAFLAVVGTVVGIIVFRSASTISGTEAQSQSAGPSGSLPVKSTALASTPAPSKVEEAKSAAKDEESKKEEEFVESVAVSGSDVYKHALSSVAWILNPRGSMGTGTLIDEKNRLVLTNYHVVFGGQNQRFRMHFAVYHEKNGELVVERDKFVRLAYNDQPNWGHVVDMEPSKDLALIRIDFVPKNIHALPVAKLGVMPGQKVYSIGNAGVVGGSLWGYFSGEVRQVVHKTFMTGGGGIPPFEVNARMVEATSPSNPGDSGGPLVNERGELIGVTQGGLASRQNMNHFIDGSEATQFIEGYFKKHGQQWVRATTSLGGATADVSELVKKLGSSDSKVRSRAIRSLARIGPPARLAVPSLLTVLKDSDDLARREVSDALNKIGPPDKKDFSVLERTLQDSSSEARAYAAVAVGKLGQDGRAYVGSLVAVLKGDKDATVRQSAAGALAQMGSFARERVGPALIEALKDTDKDVRLAAAEGLGSMEVAASDIPDLVKALKHQDLEVRKFAAQALGNLGPQARNVVPDLIDASKGGDGPIRGAAIVALGQIGADAKSAVPTITEALNQKETRDLAIVALGKIGPDAKAAVPELAKTLKVKEAQLLVVTALGNIGPSAKAAVPDLADLLKESDKEMKPTIISALGRMGRDAKPAVAALGSCLSPEDKETSIQALGILADLGSDAKDAVGDIIALFIDEDLRSENKLRSQAVRALAKIGKPAVPKLIQALSNANRYMKVGVIEALGDIGPDAKEALRTIRRLETNSDPIIRRAAASAAAKIDRS
jgi:HEAT repeat protein